MKRTSPRSLPLLAILAGVLLASGVAGPSGCRCGSAEDEVAPGAAAVVDLPDDFPRYAAESADPLASRLPAKLDFAVFLASYAAFINTVEVLKGWGILEPEQLEGVFADLERHHGINPGKPSSFVRDGLGLSDGAVLGMLDGNWFAIVRVRRKRAFVDFLDMFINEEFGRPRPKVSTHDGVEIETIYVLKKDLASVAYVGDYAYLVAGERIGGKGPSLDAMKLMLDVEPSDALSQQPAFKEVMERVGSRGPFLIYAPTGGLMQAALEPLAKGNEKLTKLVETSLRDVVEASATAISLDDERFALHTFVAIPEERMGTLLELTAPSPSDVDLVGLVHPDTTGVVRATFATKQLEALAMASLGEDAAKKWDKIKGAASVRFVMNFEDDVLHNLSGQMVATLFEFDEDALGASATALDVLDGVDAAVFFTFRDAERADGYFGKINSIKGLLPKGQVEIEDRDGVLLVTVRERRRALMRLAYYKGVLAASTGEDTVGKVLERLKGGPKAVLDPTTEALLSDGAVWGASVDMAQLVALLSARFEVVRMQIARFLSPLRRAAVTVRFEPRGLNAVFILERDQTQAE